MSYGGAKEVAAVECWDWFLIVLLRIHGLGQSFNSMDSLVLFVKWLFLTCYALSMVNKCTALSVTYVSRYKGLLHEVGLITVIYAYDTFDTFKVTRQLASFEFPIPTWPKRKP